MLAKYWLCLLFFLKCRARTVQHRPSPRRCVGHVMRQLRESSQPSSFLQNLHDHTICETCHTVEAPQPEETAGEERDHATIFLPRITNVADKDYDDSALLTIAGELLQDGFRVSVLYVYLDSSDEAAKNTDAILQRRILSSLPCEVEHTLRRHLSVRFAPLSERIVNATSSPSMSDDKEQQYRGHGDGSSSPPEIRHSSSCEMSSQANASPYDSCNLELAEPIYQSLQSLIDMEDLPDVIVVRVWVLLFPTFPS